MRTDIYAELYLCNQGVDSLLRALQRLKALQIRPDPDLAESGSRIDALRRS